MEKNVIVVLILHKGQYRYQAGLILFLILQKIDGDIWQMEQK
jgi:hypothetical protein